MNKPNNYDSVSGYGEYNRLPAGGYVCRITDVKETKTKAGDDMIEIYLDIAEGPYSEYFTNSYKNDKRENKKWGCIVYQLVLDREGSCNRGLKTFHSSVEKSNEGFELVWGEGYCSAFKDKLVGGIFRREEYERKDGSGKGMCTRCCAFRSVEAVRRGEFTVPNDKLMPSCGDADKVSAFENIAEDLKKDELPF